jgi:hypothetical protein
MGEIIKSINQKTVAHDMVYKTCVIITSGQPEDMKESVHNLVISSCKAISFIIVSLPPFSEESISRERMDLLERVLNYSDKLECYQIRRNIIHVPISSS